MTADAFCDALTKGQGRAALAASERSAAYTDAVIEACLHDQRFQPVDHHSQVPYLHYIATQAGLEQAVVDNILAELPRSPEGADRRAMIDLLGLFARTGSEKAFEALFSLADAGDHRAQDGLAASGDPGLEWCVEHILPRYSDDEQGFVWKWLINGGWDDRTPTRRRLRVIREEWMARAKAGKLPSKPNPYFLKDNAGQSPDPNLESPTEKPVFGPLWIDAETMLDEPDSERLREIVNGGRQHKPRHGVWRAMPVPEGAVLAEAACVVLAHYDSPDARTFGLELLQRTPIVPRAPIALSTSGQVEDVPLVLAFLELTFKESDTIRNAAAKDAEELARNKWDRKWQRLPEWTYEHALSADVRSSAFDWIVRVGRPTRAMLHEALYDVESYTRDLAAKKIRKPKAPFLRLASSH